MICSSSASSCRCSRSEWHVSPTAEGLVTSTALLASAVGALLFGRVADMLGRKRIYGYEVLVLAAGAIASAFSPNIWWLIVFRVILGVGIGGDYPVSSTIMSEYAGKKTRGMMVSLVFAMQAAGLIVGPLLAAGLLVTSLSHDLIWRLLLAFGACRRWRCSRCAGIWPKRRASCWQTASTTNFTRRRRACSVPKRGERAASRKQAAAQGGSFWKGFGILIGRPRTCWSAWSAPAWPGS